MKKNSIEVVVCIMLVMAIVLVPAVASNRITCNSLIASALMQGQKDQYQEQSDEVVFVPNYAWQEFVPNGLNLWRVEVKIVHWFSGSPDLTLSIEKPLGTVLSSATISVSNVPNNTPDWVEFNVPDIPLKPWLREKYYIVLSYPPGGEYGWCGAWNDPYPEGGSNKDPDWDWCFRTIVDKSKPKTYANYDMNTIIPTSKSIVDDPQIEDEIEDDVFDYLNIISAWFYENPDEPNYLYVSLKLKEINGFKLKQHLTVHWEHNGVECACGLHIGYGKPWFGFSAGYGHGWWFEEHYERISGEYDMETGVATCKIPKSIINNPQKGDMLTNTYASTFQRFGFIGRIGLDRPILRTLIEIISGKALVDFAPNEGYGEDYIIQY